ncbi:SseB family protein [Clostridium saudiense]|uniref:SseB family protein n=1 Tax=Clostridium saudiense TaxID=1414720 RepID=UPI0018AA155D|nr:SseB family protein [Clostridium saudiense]
MDNKRKDELGSLFVFNNKYSNKEFEKVTIQELVFLIYTIRVFKEKEILKNYDYDTKIITFTKVLINKIKLTKKLYIAYDKNTKYPYLDFQGRAWIFSEKEFADKAEEYFNKEETFLQMKELINLNIMNEFGKLHYLGIEKVIIDNGQYNIEINRNDILPPPDYSNIPARKIPVMNPKLQFAMIYFFQYAYSGKNYKNKAEVIRGLEANMLEEVLRAKFLLPIKLESDNIGIDSNGANVVEKGSKVNFTVIKDKDSLRWLPAFTDWYEFNKAFDKSKLKSSICSFEDILTISKNLEGIVINCNGLALKIDENNRKVIMEFMENKK